MEASDTVGELLTLQGIDLQILRIRGELKCLDDEVVALRAKAEELEARAVKLRGVAEEADERVRKFQRSVQAGRATLKRLETRSDAVANMQQHFAVRSETDTARRNLRAAEDEQLSAMQDVETARSSLTEVETELAAAVAALTDRGSQVETLGVDLESELKTHGASKKTQEDRLDRRTLQLYHSVSGGRKVSALAELTEDGVCGGCFTAVPKQRQADIRAGRGLAVCEGCGVILHPASSDA